MGYRRNHHLYAGALAVLALAASQAAAQPQPAVKVSEGAVEIPTYEFSGRETQPPLFSASTIRGQYPFVPFVRPFRSTKPAPRSYKAIFVENEYLKLTYLPEFGGRIFSLYDKVRGREVFYRNDVIKPAHYNPRISWPQSGIELTGPLRHAHADPPRRALLVQPGRAAARRQRLAGARRPSTPSTT